MKNYFKLLVLFIMIGFTTSCSDNEKVIQIDYQDELIKTRFTNTYAEFDKFWGYGIENYGLEVLCGCSCDATLSLIDVWNNADDNIPSHLKDIRMNPNSSCEDLQFIFKQRCEFGNIIDFKNSVVSGLESNEYLTNEEISLISNLLNSIVEKNVNFDAIELRWENLQTVSSINNSVSQLLIETARSLNQHQLNNPEIWDQLPLAPGEPEIAAWGWKVVGAVRGAGAAVVGIGVRDIIKNGSNQEASNLTGADVAAAAAWGAATGALSSF